MSNRKQKVLTVGEGLHARPLKGSEVVYIADQGDALKAGQAIGLMAFVAACCMCTEDGSPVYQGEKDTQKVLDDVDFSVIREVAEKVLDEAGLQDELSG